MPNLPSPPDKFSDEDDLSDGDDFPKYTSPIKFDEDNFDERPRKPLINTARFEENTDVHSERKPLFIKIDKYDDAVSTLNSVKSRLEEALSIVDELKEIRKNEDSQIEKWSEHLRQIKDKLMDVDNTLFE